jgi:hypothetical protein
MASFIAKCSLALTEDQVLMLPSQQWIPVEKRLPVIGQEVLVTTAPSFIMSVAFCTGFDGIAWFKSVDGGNALAPTHWMPLPEPPEEK